MDCCRCESENACYRAVVGVSGEGLIGVFCSDCVEDMIGGLDDDTRGPHDGCSVCDGERNYDLFAVGCIVEGSDPDDIEIEYDYSEGIVHFCYTHISLLVPPDELETAVSSEEIATS